MGKEWHDKEFFLSRVSGLQAARRCYEDGWKEIAELAHPMRSRLDVGQGTGSKPQRRENRAMRDNYGRRAARIMESGLDAGLASPSRPWFKLQTPDPAMMEFQAVKVWLHQAQDILYEFLARGTFYAASKAGWGEQGLFGTEAGLMMEHWKAPHITSGFTVGEYWTANDVTGVPSILLRRCEFPVRELVSEFGLDRVSPAVKKLWDGGSYEHQVCTLQLIEPNVDRQTGRMDAANLPWRSLWWEENAPQANPPRTDWWLRRSGFHEKPFWACRWDVVGSDAYGFGPGHDGLPELRELMKLKKDIRLLSEHLRTPPLGLPATWATTNVSLEPGAKNFVPMSEMGQATALFTPHPQALSAMREEKQDVERGIGQTFYTDLFMAISSMQGVQPRTVEEIVRRHEEQLTQLGPMVARANTEKLSVVIDRAFGIASRANMLPPAPEELQGVPLKIEFVSLLTNMQRIAGVREIEATAAFVMNLSQVNPAVLDKFDFDQAVDEFARIRGTPPQVVRSDEDVAAIREQRQQQEQMAMMAQMAQPAKDGAAAMETMRRVQNAA